MIATANPIPSSAAAFAHAPAIGPLGLLEARHLRDSLQLLLRREQAAMADFLVALADFDRRRGWEPLEHASLFAFLRVELRLSKSAAFYRKSAAELLQDFPEVIEPLRDGRLCLSTIAELSKVLTGENLAVVMPRFFGLSAREAQDLVAELQPREVPSTRMVVTRVLDRSAPPPASAAEPLLTFATALMPDPVVGGETHPNMVPLSRVLTSGLANGGGGRGTFRRDEITPLTADLRRVHFNVGKQVVMKLEAARDGLSHSIRGATMEQVLEAALYLLLEKQARARGLVKRPRTVVTTPTPGSMAPSAAAQAHPPAPPSTPTPSAKSPAISASIALRPTAPDPTPPLDLFPIEPPLHRRIGPRQHISAAVSRAVWQRDGSRCTWPLDGGGVCGSTHRLEVDHVDPWARWGGETVDDLRIVCHSHNSLAARQAFGTRYMGRYARRRS